MKNKSMIKITIPDNFTPEQQAEVKKDFQNLFDIIAEATGEPKAKIYDTEKEALEVNGVRQVDSMDTKENGNIGENE